MKNWKAYLALVLGAALLYFIVFHWSRFLADFWQPDNSRVGPNIVAALVQYTLLGVAAYLLYPPFRRAVERFSTRHVDELKEHITAEHAKIHARIDSTQARLDHIVKHNPNIPNIIPGVGDVTSPTPPP